MKKISIIKGTREGGSFQNPYIQIMRIDHWFKNIFIFPGIAFGLLVNNHVDQSLMIKIFLGVFATCFAASANYCINEYLDAEFDRLHPKKRNRPCALGLVRFEFVILQYFLLCLISIIMGWNINIAFCSTIVLFLIMGVFYNVSPIRLKDKPFIDVLTESLNNPIRFLLGWFIIIPILLPPSSGLLAYWFGGAFLMTIKRFAELRTIGKEVSKKYRPTFKYYTQEKLLIVLFFYALCAAFFLGIFLFKYRIEMVLSFPFLALLFAAYFRLGLKSDSVVQNPEKLYKEWQFVIFGVGLILFIALLMFVDIPWLHLLLSNNFS
ncbi:MAG: UbiA prenyltransferase family protein [Deltaproteobacteria bacterium]|jgi:decaprenyl-phosphate phosphoribosyltransferase|nr:UbiA prenyltransferase family protein [Deltaproteobacteria bacterium]